MKIRTKLSVFSITLAIITLIVSLLIIFIISSRAIKTQVRNHLLTIVQSRANHIETLLSSYKKTTKIFSTGNLIENAVDGSINSPLQLQQVNRRIRTIINNYTEIERVIILNKDGIVIVSSDKDVGIDKSKKLMFIKGKEKVYVGDIHKSKFSTNIVISVSSPIFAKNKFSGVIIVNFRVDIYLYKLLTDRGGLGKTGETFLVNKERYLVSPSMFNDDAILKTKIDNEQVELCFLEHLKKGLPEDLCRKVTIYTNCSGEKVLGFHYYIPEMKLCLIAEINVKEAHQPINTELFLLITIFFILLICTIIAGVLISRNITLPIVELRKGTEEIISGNLDYKVGIKSNDEIGQLSRAFDLMTSRLTESQKKLQDRAGQLEKKVKNRTIALERQFEKSEKQRIATLSILSVLNKTSKDLKNETATAKRYLDLAGVMFVAININKEVVLINKKGCETLGYDYDEIIGKNWFDNFIPEIIRNETKNVFRELMEGKLELTEYYENSVLTKNGEEKIIAWHNVAVLNENGDVNGILSSGEDITKRKKAEEENRNLIQMVEQSPAVVVLTDLSGKIEYVNPRFTSTTGYTFEEAKGQNPRILKSGETSPEEYEELWEKITKGEIWRGEFHNKKKNGELYWEDATIGSVKNEHGDITHYLAIKEDITDRKRIGNQLRRTQKMEAIGQFAGGIAHDFNNILQVIMGNVYFAEYDLPETDDRFKNIEEIRKAAEKAAALSRQLLAFSSNQILKPKDIDINILVGGLLKMIRRIIGENIELNFIGGQNPGNIHADPSQLEQIVMNLCINARDAMLEGGNLILETKNVIIDSEYCKEFSWAKEGEYALLIVRDTGFGMEKEIADKIFEPFFTTKEEGKGTGLGLATVFGIVKQHGGMINVCSEVGKGTVFKVYLPIVKKSINENEQLVESSIKGGTETILIAEDEEAIRKLATQILEGAGYKVIAAADGIEAVTFFEQNPDIALVILDIVMPNMSGPEAYKYIEKINPDVKALFCSGYSSRSFRGEFELPDEAGKMNKPYSRNSLLHEVRKILDNEIARSANDK